MFRPASLLCCSALMTLICGCGASSPTDMKPILTSEGGKDGGMDEGGKDGGMDSGVAATPSRPTACDITAKLTYRDRGTITGISEPPAEYRFSMLIDWAANTATAGAGGTARKISLVRQGDTWIAGDIAQEDLQLSLALSSRVDVGSSESGRPVFVFTEMKLRPALEGCAGEGSGHYHWDSIDSGFAVSFDAAILTGVADQSPPSFTFISRDFVSPSFPFATNDIHPLDLVGASANELLPADRTARLASTSGAMLELAPLIPDSRVGVSGFLLERRALAFGRVYALNILPSPVDLSGNQTLALPTITTMADPGFFAQDGFEGTVSAFLRGQVAIIDGTSLPIPSGAKAFHFPSSFAERETEDHGCRDRFTAHLAVVPGATTVKFSYLAYNPKLESGLMPYYSWQLAIPEGTVNSGRIGGSDVTTLPSPWTSPLAGIAENDYMELKQQALPLPAGTGSEVIFDIVRSGCTQLGSSGLVIDDLRVE